MRHMKFEYLKSVLAFNVLAIVLFSPTTTFADAAFSTFGEEDTFNNSAFVVGNLGNSPNNHFGFQFTAETSGIVESVDAAFFLFTGDASSDSVRFDIWTSEGGFPGDSIWTGAASPGSTTPSVVTATALEFDQGATLDAGVEYWLSARSTNATNGYGWLINDQGIILDGVVDANGGTDWTPQLNLEASAFRINVSPVPEPGGVFLLCTLGLAMTSRRSSNRS